MTLTNEDIVEKHVGSLFKESVQRTAIRNLVRKELASKVADELALLNRTNNSDFAQLKFDIDKLIKTLRGNK